MPAFEPVLRTDVRLRVTCNACRNTMVDNTVYAMKRARAPSAFSKSSLFGRAVFFALALASLTLGADSTTSDPEQTLEIRKDTDPSAVPAEVIASQRSELEMQEDGTVADSLQRRPDLRFNNVTVDGEKTDVSLSSMSSVAVDTVEVLKAVTPDLDADSQGGSVSVRSKPAYEQTRRTVQGRLTGTVGPRIDGTALDGTLTLGKAFGPNSAWGALVTLRGSSMNETGEARKIEWMDLENTSDDYRVLDRLRTDLYIDESQEVEFTGILDYKASDRLSLYLRGNFQASEFNHFSPRFGLRFGEGTYSDSSDQSGSVQGARAKRYLQFFESTGERWSTALGGYFLNDSIDADFRLYYGENSYSEPDYLQVDFDQREVDLSYDLQEREFPSYQQTNGDSLYDADAFTFNEMTYGPWSSADTDLIGTLNLKVNHGLGEEGTGFWKIGGKGRFRTIDRSYGATVLDAYEGDFSLADVEGHLADDSLFGGRYRANPIAGWSAVQEFRDANYERFVRNERRTREASDPATYDADEMIASGYGMGSVEVGAFRLLAGLRYEQTEVSYTGRAVIVSEDGEYESTEIRTGSSGYGNLFPGVHARYRFNDRFTLIGSWTETIARPRYRDLVPYQYIDKEDQEIEEGNPQLKPTLFTNFDLALDASIPGSGLVSLEVFSNSVSDFFFRQESILTEGPHAGYHVERLENGPTGSISGAELTWSQELGIIKPWLAPFAFNINYLWRQTSIEYPSRPGVDLPMANLPDEELTVSLIYEKQWFFGQIEVKQVSDSLFQVATIPEEDKYARSGPRIDINTTFEVASGVKLIAEVDNLTSVPGMEHYNNNLQHPHYLFTNSWAATVGVRWDI